jgi:rhodanese-related sulfurtransferase
MSITTSPTTIDRDGVRSLVESGNAIVVEALPAPYYEDAHLPGARNLPHDSDEATIAAVLPDRDATAVVYCSNLACQNSTILSRRLAQLGYTDVRDYEAGKEDWVTAGLPIESVTGAPVAER